MIRYPVPLTEILRRIDERLPTTLNQDGTPRRSGRKSWRERAAERTEQFRLAGQYNDSDGDEFWGEVKEIFAEIQHGKCAFCEIMLQERKSGNKEGDIEHFRPKRSGPKWPKDTSGQYSPEVITGDSHAGYHLLSYHPGNYLLSCHTCNQDYKRTYFPIARTRIIAGDAPEDYAAEQPYLFYPIGEVEDPERFIQFTGIIADPVADKTTDPTNYWRARVVIDFFDLNGRDALRRERAEVIEAVYLAITNLQDRIAVQILNILLSDKSRHTNCARSFATLFHSAPDRARQIVQEIIGTGR